MFTVTEPHPTVQANAYTHAGRGGAGNTFRAPSSVTPAAGVPTTLTKTVSHASSSSAASSASFTRFYSGRGGAGNACPSTERRSISLDDEYAYAAAVARSSTSGHVGRGGAGNFYKHPTDANALAATHISTADKIAQSLRKMSGRKDSNASSASEDSDSGRSGFFKRR